MNRNYATWGLLLALACWVGAPATQANDGARGSAFNIVFVEQCDGMNLTISAQRVSGVQTGCASSAVLGYKFRRQSQGAGVLVVDASQISQWEIFQTGPYAGRFFKYEIATGTQVLQGNWDYAP